jgi:type III secretion protein U
MGEKNDGGDKTEQPTRKRLDDARRKGDVAKSRDLTSTVGLLAWIVLALILGGLFAGRLLGLFEASLAALPSDRQTFGQAAEALGWAAFETTILLVAAALVPAAILGTLAEYLQAGSVLSFEKLKPSLSHLNPAEGLKRMVSMDNLVELAKTLVKGALLVAITWAVIAAALAPTLAALGPQLLPGPVGDPRPLAAASMHETVRVATRLMGWTLAAFLLVALLDMAWQRHSYMKKLRMSLRDIRDEVKQSEGDPHVKQSRRGLHQEWANQNAVQSARTANVLVVNPTHIAVAIDYDPDTVPVPLIAAMAQGPLAQAMREAAEEAGVPVIRHVDVARALFEHGRIDDFIPRDMFEAIAEIILWARQAREARL